MTLKHLVLMEKVGLDTEFGLWVWAESWQHPGSILSHTAQRLLAIVTPCNTAVAPVFSLGSSALLFPSTESSIWTLRGGRTLKKEILDLGTLVSKRFTVFGT